MRIRPFDYWAAPTLSEALAELARSGPGTMVVAGGTDLVVQMRDGRARPDVADTVVPQDRGAGRPTEAVPPRLACWIEETL